MLKKKVKGSLFIKYNKEYLEITKFHQSKGYKYFSLKQDENYQPSDWFYFSEEKRFYNLKSKKVSDIIEIVKKAKAYYKKGKYIDFYISI